MPWKIEHRKPMSVQLQTVFFAQILEMESHLDNVPVSVVDETIVVASQCFVAPKTQYLLWSLEPSRGCLTHPLEHPGNVSEIEGIVELGGSGQKSILDGQIRLDTHIGDVSHHILQFLREANSKVSTEDVAKYLLQTVCRRWKTVEDGEERNEAGVEGSTASSRRTHATDVRHVLQSTPDEVLILLIETSAAQNHSHQRDWLLRSVGVLLLV